MTKILLVEDDNNLREIYESRLSAEGYAIVAAHDGEEALAIAVKEMPDLIITDVMMPKVSGFDMLDILRTTPETKNIRVIMMTALSQADDKARADQLGADRYLVKSQVTLEDVVRTVKEVLGTSSAATAPQQIAATTTNPFTTAAEQSVQPAAVAAVAPAPVSVPTPAAPTVQSDFVRPTFVAPSPLIQQPAVQPMPVMQAPQQPQIPVQQPAVQPASIIPIPVQQTAPVQSIPMQMPTMEQEQNIVAEQINQFAAAPIQPATVDMSMQQPLSPVVNQTPTLNQVVANNQPVPTAQQRIDVTPFPGQTFEPQPE
jgi:CheY-like chemotaxis protein